MCSHNLNHEGAPHCLYEIAIGLKDKGCIDPIVFSPTDGPLRSFYESRGIQVIVDETLGFVVESTRYAARVQGFAQFIKDLDIELVFSNTVINYHTIEAAYAAGVPSLWNIHESEDWKYYQHWWGTELAEAAAKCFSYPYKVVFVAHTTKDLYKPFQYKQNFHVIHNGLNLDRIYQEASKFNRDEVRNQLGITNQELAVLLPGTVCERKGQHDLALALQLVSKNTLQRIRCFIVGDWNSPLPYNKKLHELVDALPAQARNRVVILPTTPEIFKFYKASDIFVCTSRIESFPLVVLEAMAFKLPIITTPVFGIQEQVQEGINALYYSPGDHASLAKALDRLVQDDGLRMRFSDNAIHVLRHLDTIQDMLGSYAAVFKEAYLSTGPRPLMLEGIKNYKPQITAEHLPLRKVLFISSYKDDNSQKFRVYNIIEGLTELGIQCSVIKDDFQGTTSSLLDSDLLIVFRCGFSKNLQRIIEEFKKNNIPTVFDADDLVFEPESAGLIHGLTLLSEADRSTVIEQFCQLRETLLACDYATCTTAALLKRIEALGKTGFVIPNALNFSQLSFARETVQEEKDGGKIKIGYFSGTRTHERDFLEASDAIFDLMQKYSQIEFHLVGILDLDDKFCKFGDRIVRKPLMGYLEMLQYLSTMDINLAPLEMGNVFTAGKSELKIFEAALLGIATVASATGSYEDCIKDGFNGFKASSKAEWINKLELLVLDENLRKEMACQAKVDFTEKFSIDNVIHRAVDVYSQIATRDKQPEDVHETNSCYSAK